MTRESLPPSETKWRGALVARQQPEEIRDWIRGLCRISGLTPTALAKAAGVAASTVNRFLNDEKVKHIPSMRTLAKLDAAASGAFHDRIPIAYGYGEKEGYNLLGAIGHPNEDFQRSKSDEPLRLVRVITVSRTNEWYKNPLLDPKDQYLVSVLPLKQDDYDPKFGVVIQDSSMNILYPPNSVVICVPFIYADRNPSPGQRVLLQRRNQEGQYELTIREFRIDKDGQPWLWPRSDDPQFQTPIKGITKEDNDLNLRIPALVVAAMTDESLPE